LFPFRYDNRPNIEWLFSWFDERLNRRSVSRLVDGTAHVVRRLKKSRIRVIFGDHDQSTTTDGETITRMVSSIVRHRNFDVNSYNHDVALLRLRKSVSFTKSVRPICLPLPSTYNFRCMIMTAGLTGLGRKGTNFFPRLVYEIHSNGRFDWVLRNAFVFYFVSYEIVQRIPPPRQIWVTFSTTIAIVERYRNRDNFKRLKKRQIQSQGHPTFLTNSSSRLIEEKQKRTVFLGVAVDSNALSRSIYEHLKCFLHSNVMIPCIKIKKQRIPAVVSR